MLTVRGEEALAASGRGLLDSAGALDFQVSNDGNGGLSFRFFLCDTEHLLCAKRCAEARPRAPEFTFLGETDVASRWVGGQEQQRVRLRTAGRGPP